MSEENVEVVRQPITLADHSHRRLEERLALRFPRLVTLLARAVWRLPPRSRVRQAMLRRTMCVAYEASNRRDYEVTFLLHHPNCELTTPPQLVALGFDPVYRGRDERIRFQRKWVAEWGEFRFALKELIDLGDRLLVIGAVRGSGLSSGVPVAQPWANLFTVSAGQVTAEQILAPDEALEAAGLSEWAMSEENVEILRGVRTPVTVSSETRGRTLDERIFVRFPALVRLITSAWSRLPPRSRLRRALTSRFIRQGCEAANRRDFEVLLLALDPEIELHFDESPVGGFVPPDLLGVHRGREAYRRVWKAGIEAMEDLRLEHEEVIDYGDRLLAVGRQTGHGTSSGVPVSMPLFQVFTLRRGLVVREEDFADRDKAFEAAGRRG